MTHPAHSALLDRQIPGRLLKVRTPLPTLAFYTALLMLDHTGLARMGLLCALLHESGHILAFWVLLHRLPKLELKLSGICLSMKGVLLAPWQENLLAAAGPAANLLLAAAALLWMDTAGRYSYVGCWFTVCNLLVGTFNLLPLPGFDGRRLTENFSANRKIKVYHCANRKNRIE